MKMTSYAPRRSLYEHLSGFSRQSLAASQVARIVGNCFRNPAQMRSRSRSRSLRFRSRANGGCGDVAHRTHSFAHARNPDAHERVLLRKGQRRSSCVNHSAKLQQLRETGRKSAHTIRVRSHFVVSHALFHSRFAQILNGYRDRTASSFHHPPFAIHYPPSTILRSFFLTVRARLDSYIFSY